MIKDSSEKNTLSEIIIQFQRTIHHFPEIRYAGDPILRTPTKETSVQEGRLIGEKLGHVLLEYRKQVGYGRGLAAPQIGINASVFVTYTDDNLHTFINPTIIERSSTTNFYRELCLSCGILSADVQRPQSIVMEWFDQDGAKHKTQFDGFLARLYQHEYAHLMGKLTLDEAEPHGIAFALFDPLQEQLRDTR